MSLRKKYLAGIGFYDPFHINAFRTPAPKEKPPRKETARERLNWDDPLQVELRKMNNNKLTHYNRASYGKSYLKRLKISKEINNA